jgi:hypothetical protein
VADRAVASRAGERPAVEQDAADTDLAGHEDDVRRAHGHAAHVLGQGAEIGVVAHDDGAEGA